MQRIMMKSKLHRARVTDADLEYEGSMSIDDDLMRLADIVPYEQIKVYNVNNGARFDTYAISAPAGSGMICLNGAAARMGARGDRVIIVTYGHVDEAQIAGYAPRVVLLDSNNKPVTQQRGV